MNTIKNAVAAHLADTTWQSIADRETRRYHRAKAIREICIAGSMIGAALVINIVFLASFAK